MVCRFGSSLLNVENRSPGKTAGREPLTQLSQCQLEWRKAGKMEGFGLQDSEFLLSQHTTDAEIPHFCTTEKQSAQPRRHNLL